MEVFLCYTYDEKHKIQLIKVIGDFQSSRDWLHNRTDLIIKMNKLFAKYLLTRGKKEQSRAYSKYRKFREQHELFDNEFPHHPFIHRWGVS